MKGDALDDFEAACAAGRPRTPGANATTEITAQLHAEEEHALAKARHSTTPALDADAIEAAFEADAAVAIGLVPSAKAYVAAYNARDEARKVKTAAEAEVDATEDQLLTEMVASEVPQLKVAGRTLFIRDQLRVRSATGDHAGLAKALLDAGRGDLIIVGPARLKSELKDDEALAGMHPAVLAHLLIEKVPRIGSRKAT